MVPYGSSVAEGREGLYAIHTSVYRKLVPVVCIVIPYSTYEESIPFLSRVGISALLCWQQWLFMFTPRAHVRRGAGTSS